MIAAIVAFLVGLHCGMFYLYADPTSYNLARLWWCLAASLLGFSFLSIQVLNHRNSPLPAFLRYYPVMLLVSATLVFSACHLFRESSGFVFYPLSFSVSFILGYVVDKFFDIIVGALRGRDGAK